jgi:hypothetical protein
LGLRKRLPMMNGARCRRKVRSPGTDAGAESD